MRFFDIVRPIVHEKMICEHHVTTQPLTATTRRHAVVIFDGGS